jgi:hypothetical protein
VTLARVILIIFSSALLACASHDGLYEPACAAYEGDTLVLSGGRFEWQRFTDERVVDESGNSVTRFPGFPKTGTYRFSGQRLELLGDDGVRLQGWFAVTLDGQHYLLDTGQHNAYLDSGAVPECALKLAADNPR